MTTKGILDSQGADAVVDFVKSRKEVLLTDTTFRDAHQSLLATRVRLQDMKQVASAVDKAYQIYFLLRCGEGQPLTWLIVF